MKRILVLSGAVIALGLASGCNERPGLMATAGVGGGKADIRMGRNLNHNETLLRTADMQRGTNEQERR